MYINLNILECKDFFICYFNCYNNYINLNIIEQKIHTD